MAILLAQARIRTLKPIAISLKLLSSLKGVDLSLFSQSSFRLMSLVRGKTVFSPTPFIIPPAVGRLECVFKFWPRNRIDPNGDGRGKPLKSHSGMTSKYRSSRARSFRLNLFQFFFNLSRFLHSQFTRWRSSSSFPSYDISGWGEEVRFRLENSS